MLTVKEKLDVLLLYVEERYGELSEELVGEEVEKLVDKVLNWTVKNMQDPHDGYFYYQLKKGISSKIPYMRWAQAWMFYGLSFMLLDKAND